MRSKEPGPRKKKSSVAWKALERLVGRYFGTTRTALSGGNSKVTRSDTMHPNLFIECKYRKRLSTWQLWADTDRLAREEGKIPVVVLKQAQGTGFLLVVHCNDFEDVAHEVELMYPVEPEDIVGLSEAFVSRLGGEFSWQGRDARSKPSTMLESLVTREEPSPGDFPKL